MVPLGYKLTTREYRLSAGADASESIARAMELGNRLCGDCYADPRISLGNETDSVISSPTSAVGTPRAQRHATKQAASLLWLNKTDGRASPRPFAVTRNLWMVGRWVGR